MTTNTCQARPQQIIVPWMKRKDLTATLQKTDLFQNCSALQIFFGTQTPPSNIEHPLTGSWDQNISPQTPSNGLDMFGCLLLCVSRQSSDRTFGELSSFRRCFLISPHLSNRVGNIGKPFKKTKHKNTQFGHLRQSCLARTGNETCLHLQSAHRMWCAGAPRRVRTQVHCGSDFGVRVGSLQISRFMPHP